MSDIPEKRCPACGESFPATAEFFFRNKSHKDGLYGRCKSCQYKKQKEYDKAFYSNPEARERRQVYHKAYYARPEIQERQRAFAQDYYSRPGKREHHDALMKDYNSRPDIQEHRHAQQKTYLKTYLSVPENRAKMLANGRTRRARKKAVSGTHTAAQILEQLKRQKHKCYYCAAKFEKTKGRYVYHIDHTFPLSRVAGTDIPANDMSYLVLACPKCNQSKHDRFPWEFPEGGRLL